MKNYKHILLRLPWVAVLVIISVLAFYLLQKSDTANKASDNIFDKSAVQNETENKYYFVSDKDQPITNFTEEKLSLIKSINTAFETNDYVYINSKIFISKEAGTLVSNILKLDTNLKDEYSLYKSLIPPREDMFSEGYFFEPIINFVDTEGSETSPIGFAQKATSGTVSTEYVEFTVDGSELKIDLSASIKRTNDFLVWTIDKKEAEETN